MNSTHPYLDWIRIRRCNSGKRSVVRMVLVHHVVTSLDDAKVLSIGDGKNWIAVAFYILLVVGVVVVP